MALPDPGAAGSSARVMGRMSSAAPAPIAIPETPGRILPRMSTPPDYLGFTPLPGGWAQEGERWGLRWGGREIASVQPDAQGIRVILSCRKLWQIKEVRAASVSQGKRYAERWCAARVLEGVPLKEAVARLVATEAPPRQSLTPTERQQLRRLNAVPPPKL